MSSYIDAFTFPIAKEHVSDYQSVAEQVAAIWKEYGALSYSEYVSDDMHLEGTRSFLDSANAQEGEVVIFGWAVFPSKEVRDNANEQVPKDKRMHDLVAPLMDPNKLIFDASRMVYGGFNPLVNV